MSSAVVFYFSGTGNTWFAAETLSQKLNDLGIVSTIYSIEKVSPVEANKAIEEGDIAVFCYPVYASYLPKPMEKFINSLCFHNKESAVLCTQMMFSGDAAAIGAKLLAEKGFKTKWGTHLNMLNNLNCGIFSFLPITNDAGKLEKMRIKTELQIANFAGKIASNQEYLQGFSTFGYMLGRTQRPKNHLTANQKWGSVMSINHNDCSSCGLCYKICPMKNIEKTDTKYVIGNNCSACMRCHNFCKTKAIYFKSVKSKKESYHGPIKDFDVRALVK